MNNGDVVTMPKAHYQDGNDFFVDKNKLAWLGSIQGNHFVSCDITNRVEKRHPQSLQNIVLRMRAKDQFNYAENEQLMNLKKLLTGYKPLSGKYK